MIQRLNDAYVSHRKRDSRPVIMLLLGAAEYNEFVHVASMFCVIKDTTKQLTWCGIPVYHVAYPNMIHFVSEDSPCG